MKKFVSLFLIFSILALSGNLFAKKQGAELIVQKKDGQQVRGELIAIKENSLLMLVSGVDVSIDIQEILIIKIVKKSKALLGFVGGVAVAYVIEKISEPPNIYIGYPPLYASARSLIFPSLGLLIGAVAGINKTIQIYGRSREEIKEVLEYLRSKARIPNYQ